MSPHQKSNSTPALSDMSISQLMSHEARTIGLPANFTGSSIVPGQRHLACALPSIGNVCPRIDCALDVSFVHEGTTCTVRSSAPVGGGGTIKADANSSIGRNVILTPFERLDAPLVTGATNRGHIRAHENFQAQSPGSIYATRRRGIRLFRLCRAST